MVKIGWLRLVNGCLMVHHPLLRTGADRPGFPAGASSGKAKVMECKKNLVAAEEQNQFRL